MRPFAWMPTPIRSLGRTENIELLKEFPIASIEAPIIPGDHQALKSYTDACPWEVVVDENLLTPDDAVALGKLRACTVFNVGAIKCGIYRSLQMIKAAQDYGLKLQIGAQVGETAILSAAAKDTLTLLNPMSSIRRAPLRPLAHRRCEQRTCLF